MSRQLSLFELIEKLPRVDYCVNKEVLKISSQLLKKYVEVLKTYEFR